MAGRGDDASPPRHESGADTTARVKRELAELVTERDRAESRRRELTDQIRAGLRRANDLGVPWVELAELVGYSSAETARVQALRPEGDHPPGSVSISEAAERLGVSRQTIYDHIRTGRLTLAVDRPRGRRVYLPEGTTPVP